MPRSFYRGSLLRVRSSGTRARQITGSLTKRNVAPFGGLKCIENFDCPRVSNKGSRRDNCRIGSPKSLTRRTKPLHELGDFAEFGGESYENVQTRVRAFYAKLEAEHRASADRVAIVGHGGFNYQLLKMLVCEPVPRVCIVRMGNCSATLVRLRERRGTYRGELVWHVPVELMGGASGEGAARIFR